MAAREGNLRDLLSALDRRKFAIARDGSSPHGATPLHIAVIFGHTLIIRYKFSSFINNFEIFKQQFLPTYLILRNQNSKDSLISKNAIKAVSLNILYR